MEKGINKFLELKYQEPIFRTIVKQNIQLLFVEHIHLRYPPLRASLSQMASIILTDILLRSLTKSYQVYQSNQVK